MHFKLELFREMIEGFLIRLGKVQTDTYTVLTEGPSMRSGCVILFISTFDCFNLVLHVPGFKILVIY